MGFAVFTLVILAVVIVLLVLGNAKNPLNTEMGKLQSWLDKNNFKITSSVRSVLIDENTKRWAVYKSEQSPIYDFKDIIKVELDENGNKYVSQNGVLRAVVGSAIFGDVGAVVGAATASRSHTVNSLNVMVYTSNISAPVITIPFITTPMPDSSPAYQILRSDAIKLVGAFNAIAMQSTSSNSKPDEKSPEAPSSAADELAKYKKLLDDGAISEEEYSAVKKRLLNL